MASQEQLENAENDAKIAESQKDYFAATIHYKEALKLARQLGLADRIKQFKNKITTLSKQIEYKSFEVEQEIPRAETEQFVSGILAGKKDLELTLDKIGLHPSLCPRKEHVLNQPMPITYQIATLNTFSSKGDIIKGGSDPETAWYTQMYQIHQELITHFYLTPLFKALTGNRVRTLRTGTLRKHLRWVVSRLPKRYIDAEDLFEYFKNKRVLSGESLELLGHGINKYFEDDFMSALHILIPQFEAVFMTLSERLGVDTTALESGPDIATRTRILSEQHLDSKEIIAVWGEDLCEQIKFLLFSPLGYRLRHKIAHGEISPAECNNSSVELILYLFLALVSRIEVAD